MTAALPPELGFLLALLRAALGGPPPAPPPAGLDWKNLLALVERHRVGVFLHHRAAVALAALCPPEVGTSCHATASHAAQRALRVAAQQLRLLRLLAAAGIEAMPVKGLVLADRLYGGIGRRHIGDLDLLVRPADALRADGVLQAAGLRRTRPDFSLTPRQARAYLALKPEFEYHAPATPLRVELLWRLEGLPRSIDPFAGAVVCSPGGQPVRTLAPGLEALYLFQHGARHGWFRLFWLLDIALLLRAPGCDWTRVAEEARASGLERSLFQGAALARDLLGATVPPALAPSAREERAIAALARESCRQIARTPAEDEPFGEWLRQTVYRVRLQKSVRAKFAMMAPHLFSPLNWHTLPLPDRWFFLYPALSPFLAAWRRLRRPR